ncbi:preQ(1) synthase [bacterium]|nr:preQ(1) synthase [bacterium]HNJ72674.1 preQ(1) synthase [bacterium]
MKKKIHHKHVTDAKAFVQKPDFKFKFDGYEAIRPELIETFAYENPGQPQAIVVSTEEFTAVCPWSGLPDFARIVVTYVPRQKIIELRSYKYYLYSYRNVGIFQEHLTPRLLQDLVAACEPESMTVKTDYNIRGGIHTVCEASYRRNTKRR